jgi:putative transcriptional regulator
MASNYPGSLKGHFLMAMPGLLDPNFSQTVTCICEHTDQGAMGIVINRILESLCAKNIFDELSIRCSRNAEALPIYIGGPVHSGELFILHGPPFTWRATLQVTASLGLSNTSDILEAIAASRGPESFLISLGCAGWGPGQLEHEIKENAWLTQPVFEENIFVLPFNERWAAALKKMGVDPVVLSDTAGHA